MSDSHCTACGAPVAAYLNSCGRCGQPRAAAAGAATTPPVPTGAGWHHDATTVRSALAAPTPAVPAALPVAPPLPAAPFTTTVVQNPPWHPPTEQPATGPARPPAELWVVAAVLAGTGLLFLWPIVRLAVPLARGMAAGGLALAFSAVFMAMLVLVAVWGAVFVLLAVQLVRRRPHARILTMILAGAVSLGFLVAGRPGAGVSSRDTTSVLVGLAAGAVVVVLAVSPRIRHAFSTSRTGVPLAVEATAALGVYLGVDLVAAGLMLLPLAALSAEVAVGGGVIVALGIGLLIVTRALRRGSPAARWILTAVLVVEFSLLVWVTAGQVTPGAAIAAGVAVGALFALWVDPASAGFFSPSSAAVPDGGTRARSERVVAGVIIATAGVGALLWALSAALG